MKSYLSHTLLNAVQRLVDAPEQTLSKISAGFSTVPKAPPSAAPPPASVMLQLESAFEALSELPFQPSVAAALELACETLQSELPSEAIAAGVYDINADEMRIVAARGLERDLLRGTTMARGRCFAGRASQAAFVISGGVNGIDWLGSGEEGAEALLCPIVVDAHLLGVLAVADPLCAQRFTIHDIELVSYVAGQLGSFIHSFRQRPSIPAPRLVGRP